MTSTEVETQMHELHAHVTHLEKTLATVKESRERSEAAKKVVIQRLVAENMSVIEEVRAVERAGGGGRASCYQSFAAELNRR
jgi:ferritin-like metal-binding protein YciE